MANNHFDQAHFDTQLSRLFGLYMSTTKKGITEAANTRSRYVVGKAFEMTPKADKDRIKAQLNEARPGGKTLAELILAKQGKLTGTKAENKKTIRRFIGARRRSVGFVKSGWVPAFQQLGKSIGKNGFPAGGKGLKRGKDKGYAKPARAKDGRALDTEVVYANTVTVAKKVGERALIEATKKEAASLKQHLEKKLRTDLSHIRI